MTALSRMAFAVILSGAVAALYLAAPKVPPPLALANCIFKFPLTAEVVLDTSCDSPSFMLLANRPDCLLAPNCRWQSRPLYVLSGTLLRLPFVSSSPPDGLVEEVRPSYLGFVTFNLVVLAVAVVLFESLLAGAGSPLVVHLLAVVLLTNDVVRLLVWSPHLQMLSILQPLLLIAVIRHVATRADLAAGRAVGYGLAAGVAPMFYGSGFLLLPGLVLGCLLRPSFGNPQPPARTLRTIASMTAAFLVPLGLWVGLLLARNGVFYSHEVGRFRQFVWLLDAYREQGIAAAALQLAGAVAVFVEKLVRIGWFPLALVLGAGLLASSQRGILSGIVRRSRAVVLAALAALLLNLVFFVLLGFYTERLSVNLVPPLIVLAGVLLAGHAAVLPAARRRFLHAGLLGVVLCWAVWQGRREEPWSFYRSAISAANGWTFTPSGARPERAPRRRPSKGGPVEYGDCPRLVLVQPGDPHAADP